RMAAGRGPKTPPRGGPAGPRVALVIGNGAYAEGGLANPVNDARDMAATLRQLGFDVLIGENCDRRQMEELIRKFGGKIRGGGVGMFYFAGHGVQVNGANYLIPIGAVIKGEAVVKYEAVDAGFVMAQMEDARNRLNIAVLDACRNNPFARSFRSSSGGLASVDAPVWKLIAYATAPGRTASDGNGRNGLYTKELLAAMRVPGLKIEDVFKQVRSEVRRQSNDQQIPWESSSIEGDFYFSTSGVRPAPLAPAPTPTTSVPPYPKSTDAYSDRGMVYFGKKEYDLAIAEYSEAIRLDPKSAEIYSIRGLAYACKSDYDRAFEDCNEAIRIAPKLTVPYYVRGVVYVMTKDYDQAIADFNEATRL